MKVDFETHICEGTRCPFWGHWYGIPRGAKTMKHPYPEFAHFQDPIPNEERKRLAAENELIADATNIAEEWAMDNEGNAELELFETETLRTWIRDFQISSPIDLGMFIVDTYGKIEE